MRTEQELRDELIDLIGTGAIKAAGLELKFYLVTNGIPGIDGVYKTHTVSSEFDSLDRAQEGLRRLARTRSYAGRNLRIQYRWATKRRDLVPDEEPGDDVPARGDHPTG